MMGLFHNLVAIQREIDLAFAVVMMIGVALVLGGVALAAVLFRQRLPRLLATRPRAVDAVTRAIQSVAGVVVVVVAVNAIRG